MPTKTRHERICIAALGLFLLLLWLPLIQRATGLFPVVELDGVEKTLHRPSLKPRTWMDGSFQRAYGPYFVRKMGLRGFLVRTANQLRLSLFKEYSGRQSRYVVIGKEGWFFIRGYIAAANGTTVYPDERFEQEARQVRAVQDEFDRRGIPFLFVIAPNKADIYAEYVPDHLFTPGREERGNGYSNFLPYLRREGVRVLDLHAWFREHRDDGPHPLYTMSGTHWSDWSAALSGRMILDRLQEQFDRPIAKYRVVDSFVDQRPVGLDADVVNLMNIWWRDHLVGPQVHPVLEPDRAEGALRPNVLLVGDSFTWGLHRHFDAMEVFSKRDTFFYFRTRMSWPSGGQSKITKGSFDWERDVFERDAVVMLYTARYLPGVNRGFCTGAMNYLRRKGRK